MHSYYSNSATVILSNYKLTDSVQQIQNSFSRCRCPGS